LEWRWFELEIASNYKKELIGILIEINRLVTEHLKVQKSISKPPFGAKIFKRIDYENLYETSKKIQSEIYQITRKMHNNKNELNKNQFIYNGIKDYTLLFHNSSEKLTQIALELHLKATKQNKLTIEEYNLLVNEYQKFENIRMQKGNTIQTIAGMLAK
jgi:predicted RNA methylase